MGITFEEALELLPEVFTTEEETSGEEEAVHAPAMGEMAPDYGEVQEEMETGSARDHPVQDEGGDDLCPEAAAEIDMEHEDEDEAAMEVNDGGNQQQQQLQQEQDLIVVHEAKEKLKREARMPALLRRITREKKCSLQQADENLMNMTITELEEALAVEDSGVIMREDYDEYEKLNARWIESLNEGDEEFDRFVRNENPIIQAGVGFHKGLQRGWETCSCCQESYIFLDVSKKSGRCAACEKSKARRKIFSPENDLLPTETPPVLARLTPVEKSAISIICPTVAVYKKGATSASSKGHTFSFLQDVQDLATSLPRLPSQLPFILLKGPNEGVRDKTFRVNRQNILEALQYLREHSEDYSGIDINMENLMQFPLDGYLDDLPQLDVPMPQERPTAVNEESAMEATSLVPMPFAQGTELEKILEALQPKAQEQQPGAAAVQGEQASQEGDSEGQHGAAGASPAAGSSSQQNTGGARPLPWPKRKGELVSEFVAGFFSKAFPDLFCDGKGDVTKPRLGKNPSLPEYFRHLLRTRRQFASHHSFLFVATNMVRRHEALTRGNVFARRCAEDLPLNELKKAVEEGDDRVIKKLMHFGAPIKGTRQYMRFKSDQAHSFVRFIRLNSGDTEMTNYFATFSAADLHWDDLHVLLPGSEHYLYSELVDRPEQLREGKMLKSEDFRLRCKALQENTDLVDEYFYQRMHLLIKEVLPSLGMTDYLIRFEVQARGTIHAHVLMCIEGGPCEAELRTEWYENPESLEVYGPEDEAAFERVNEKREKIRSIQEKLIRFSTKKVAVSAVHPNANPHMWPAPYGQNVQAPSTNCLRERFLELEEAGELKKHYEMMVNRTMLHHCRVGYCLKQEGAGGGAAASKKAKKQGANGREGQEKEKKGEKEKDKDKKACRFGFPQEPLGYQEVFNQEQNRLIGVVRDPAVAPEGATVIPKEGGKPIRNHRTIVTHNPDLLAIWGANIEGRPVKNYKQLLAYVLKYMLKAEPNSEPFSSLAKAVVGAAKDDEPTRKAFQKILMKTIGEHDLSKQEAAHILQKHDFVEFSREFVSVNVMGTRRVRTPQTEDDRGSATEENVASQYWSREEQPKYKEALQKYEQTGRAGRDPRSVTLYEFASKYSPRTWVLTGKEKVPHVTPSFSRIPRRNGKSQERYLMFLRSLLLVHKAGTRLRDLEDLEKQELEGRVKTFVETDECPALVKSDFLESQAGDGAADGKENLEDSEEEASEQEEGDELAPRADPEQEAYQQDEWMEALRPIPRDAEAVYEGEGDYDDLDIAAQANDHDWDEDAIALGLSDQDLLVMQTWVKEKADHHIVPPSAAGAAGNQLAGTPADLNDKQFKAFSIIWQHMLRDKAYRDGRAESPPSQLLMNITGSAGTGKSFFLNTLRAASNSLFPGDSYIAAAAPSGTAAFLIRGETLHRMLCLPVGKASQFEDLQGPRLMDLQGRFADVGLLVIDEKSMIGQEVFTQVHRRLGQARAFDGGERPFGGLSVVLLGDWKQLPPVADAALFVERSITARGKKTRTGGSRSAAPDNSGYNLYRHFDKSIIFDHVQRQEGESQRQFREELGRLGRGEFTQADWRRWRTRALDLLPATERKAFLDEAILACALKKDMVAHNVQKVKATGHPVAPISALSRPARAATENSDRSCNLLSKIILSRESTVRLTANLWTSAGLTNGAVGVVKYILYRRGCRPPALPSAVIVSFDNYIGPSFLPGVPRSVPIVPVQRDWYDHKVHCQREMLPLILGYALSIHKLQGSTCDRVILNPGEVEFATGLLLVGATRTKTFEGLAFSPCPNFERFEQINRSKVSRWRVRHCLHRSCDERNNQREICIITN